MMLQLRRALVSLLLVAALPACIELDGQRLKFEYDADTDQATLWIYYDGIHNSKTGMKVVGESPSPSEIMEDGVQQLREFVEAGNVMLADWYLYFDHGNLRRDLESGRFHGAMEAFVRAWCDLAHVELIGHYRDPDGRIGALQRVRIDDFSIVLHRLNEAINDGILSEGGGCAMGPRTMARIDAAAHDGWRWVEHDGPAVRLRFPVDPAEWSRLRRDEVLKSLLEFSDVAEGERAAFANLIGGMSWSLDQAVDVITIRLGNPEVATVARVKLREGYGDGYRVDEEIRELVPLDLDERMARALLGIPGAPIEPEALLPEDVVRALLRAVSWQDDWSEDATKRLVEFGREWNRSVGVPEAPQHGADSDRERRAWEAFYRALAGT